MIRRLTRTGIGSHQLALGFAAGAFASFTPFVGFHFILAALFALILRGNLIASAVGTVVGNPVTFPFIWLASYNLGALLQGRPTVASLELDVSEDDVGLWSDGPVTFAIALWENISPYIVPMLLGGIPLGVLCGAICYFAIRTALDQYNGRRRMRTAD
jgi:uncharacterized protein